MNESSLVCQQILICRENPEIKLFLLVIIESKILQTGFICQCFYFVYFELYIVIQKEYKSKGDKSSPLLAI